MKRNGAGPTDSQTRAERIHETVRARILTNRYPPGTTLREGELAEEFGVSRSPIRRAFARLEEARLLEIRHGVGALVTEIQAEAFFAAYDVRMLLLAQSGPYFVSPFPSDASAFFGECRDRFLSLEEGDVIGFAQVQVLQPGVMQHRVGGRSVQPAQHPAQTPHDALLCAFLIHQQGRALSCLKAQPGFSQRHRAHQPQHHITLLGAGIAK